MRSVILHLVIAFVVELYLVSQMPQFEEMLGGEILEPVTTPKPKERFAAVTSNWLSN